MQVHSSRPTYINTRLPEHTHVQSGGWLNRLHASGLCHFPPAFSELLLLSLPQVSSALAFAVFCPLSTSLQYWWGLEVQPAAGHTVWGASYTVSVLEWFVYLKTVRVGGYDVCAHVWCRLYSSYVVGHRHILAFCSSTLNLKERDECNVRVLAFSFWRPQIIKVMRIMVQSIDTNVCLFSFSFGSVQNN